MTKRIPFNLPRLATNTQRYVQEALLSTQMSSNGPFTRECERLLSERMGAPCLLVHSATAALEIMAMLADIGPGDEVIMPSFTFSSTANAVVLRGGVPVFADIDPLTLNLNPRDAAAAITARTKAIMPIHYAGVACDTDAFDDLAAAHDLLILPDAAQAIGSMVNGREVASWGHLSALSFHETKNVSSGEGGALVINEPRFLERAEIIRDKGTNRSAFMKGQVDKYTWVDIGSSYGPGEVVGAMLRAQLEEADIIGEVRRASWERYHHAFADAEERSLLRRPTIPENQTSNHHIYYLLAPDLRTRDHLLSKLMREKIHAVFHYVPLHSAPAGRRYGRVSGTLAITDQVSSCLLRLPLFHDLDINAQDRVIDRIYSALGAGTNDH